MNQNGALNKSDSPRFPFLGSLKDGELFEYLLLSIEADFAEIALLPWFINRAQLHIDDIIDLYLPSILSITPHSNRSILGTVMSAKYNEESQGVIYQISLSKQKTDFVAEHYLFDQYTQQLPATASLTDILIHLIKDSMNIKAGIRVYFKHFTSYFSRIGQYSNHEYGKLKTYFFRDIEKHIMDNEANLEKLYRMAMQKITKSEEIPIYIDLEALREITESEISLSVFNVVFSEKEKVNFEDASLLTNPQYGIFMYLNAIKKLERHLYYNYNNIVILYLKSLT